MLIHSKRSHRSIAKIEGTLINTEHIIYSFSVSATIAWLSIYRRAAGPAPSSKKLSRITSRHTTVVKWGRRILRRYSGTCPSSGWLFLKHAVRFFPDCKSGFFPRGYSHSARMDFHGWEKALEARLQRRYANPENDQKNTPGLVFLLFSSHPSG